jgi:hypothetical protein
MEAVCSSEKLVNFYWTAWHYILEDSSTSSQPDNLLDKNINTMKKNTDLYLHSSNAYGLEPNKEKTK